MEFRRVSSLNLSPGEPNEISKLWHIQVSDGKEFY